MLKSSRFSKGEMPSWMVILIAFLLAFLSAGILSWQYHNISQREIVSLKGSVEMGSAGNVLEGFMVARISRNEAQAKIYFTENTMDQYMRGKFSLINNFQVFEVLKKEQLVENKFRFIVNLCEQNKINCTSEVVTLIKILDRYYLDSLELAG